MTMKNLTTEDMNEVFERLAKIKMVEPSAKLYTQTLYKLNRQNIISLTWVKAIACILIVCISTELYFTFSTYYSLHTEASNTIYVTNNILYHE